DDYPNWYGPYVPEGMEGPRGSGMIADHRSVTSGYLPAMGARLIEGRFFDTQDRAESRQVVIVDELVARSAWPAGSAVGKKIECSHVIEGTLSQASSVVIGVVEHIRNHSVTREVRPVIYVPYEQSRRSPLTWVVRTAGDPSSLVAPIRRMMQQRNPDL